MKAKGLLRQLIRDQPITFAEASPVRWRLERIRNALRATDTNSLKRRALALEQARKELDDLEKVLFGPLPTIEEWCAMDK
ncbi:hypothetical protein LCGC14_0446580 [marine sediment metagenome]|uniref:Uncharacterized protein n=1 Tax=marine sediment metagenome TaxID=412755 RepID=A0A0F9T254_9ZZZZ